MLKINGKCNHCGSCCGFGSYSKCALPYAFWKWDKQHPELGLLIVKKIKEKIGDKVNVSGKVNISKVGLISFYLSEDGLQTSPTDNTCPFFDQKAHLCRIWNTPYIPDICKDPVKGTPQSISEDRTEKWSQDHPLCGFNWAEK